MPGWGHTLENDKGHTYSRNRTGGTGALLPPRDFHRGQSVNSPQLTFPSSPITPWKWSVKSWKTWKKIVHHCNYIKPCVKGTQGCTRWPQALKRADVPEGTLTYAHPISYWGLELAPEVVDICQMTGEPGGIYAITHRGRKWGEALRKVGEKELPVVTTYGGGHGSLEKCHILKISTPPTHTHTSVLKLPTSVICK